MPDSIPEPPPEKRRRTSTKKTADLPSGPAGDGPEQAMLEPRRKMRYNFNIFKDIELMTAVLAKPPCKAAHGTIDAAWVNIADALQQRDPILYAGVNGVNVKRRVELLQETYKNKNEDSLKQSGTIEEHTKLDDLVNEYIEMVSDN